MAKSQTTAERLGVTPAKLGLIGGLAAVLLVVLYLQFGSSESPANPAPAAAKQAPPRRAAQRAAARKPSLDQLEDDEELATEEQLDPTLWVAPELTTVIQYDPFALPAAFPQPALIAAETPLTGEGSGESFADTVARQTAAELETMERQLVELRQRGVQVILRGPDQYTAMIGDRTVFVGDEISGFTVTAIDSDGVRVEGTVKP